MKPKGRAEASVQKAKSYSSHDVSFALANLFESLGLDSENPFEETLSPGDQVFIKPNWVADNYRKSCPKKFSRWTTITHPNLLHEIARLADRALEGRGQIIIGDCPSIDADFSQLNATLNLRSLVREVRSNIAVVDLRPQVCTSLHDYGKKDRMRSQVGDPRGTVQIDLGEDSMLNGVDPERFRGVFEDTSETVLAHSNGHHRYTFSRSIIESDLLISVPKLKTHHKVGTTLNIKGLVGTITEKNQLVHWRSGYPAIGGDEYPTEEIWKRMQTAQIQKRGAWMGNDTIWRMVCDLYVGFLKLRDERPNFSIIDGVIGGQGEGPFCPEPRRSEVLIGSSDLLVADVVATRMMGFDISAIPYLRHLTATNKLELSNLTVANVNWQALLSGTDRLLNFKPPHDWRGALVDASASK
jgi:uncharacterized protein (DUF362 family)